MDETRQRNRTRAQSGQSPEAAAVGRSTRLRRACCWLGLLLPLAGGCVTLDGLCPAWLGPNLPPHGNVTQVMALWADSIVIQPDPVRNGVPTPGLAARVYLIGNDLACPLAGDGTLSVYLYDAAQPLSEHAVPQEIWNLDPVNLERVLTHDALGWGYDLWLPWRTYQPGVSRVRLVVKYQAPQGTVAWSSSTDYAVHGQGLGTSGPGPIQPARAQAPAAPGRS